VSSGTIPAARPGAEYAAGSAVYSIATLLTSGADHPDTLISRNNLAGAYRDAGNPGRAIPLPEQAPWPTGCGYESGTNWGRRLRFAQFVPLSELWKRIGRRLRPARRSTVSGDDASWRHW
jgi:hypothetical protein